MWNIFRELRLPSMCLHITDSNFIIQFNLLSLLFYFFNSIPSPISFLTHLRVTKHHFMAAIMGNSIEIWTFLTFCLRINVCGARYQITILLLSVLEVIGHTT
jgi:hypothetical protein